MAGGRAIRSPFFSNSPSSQALELSAGNPTQSSGSIPARALFRFYEMANGAKDLF